MSKAVRNRTAFFYAVHKVESSYCTISIFSFFIVVSTLNLRYDTTTALLLLAVFIGFTWAYNGRESPASDSRVSEPFALISPYPISNTMHLQLNGAAIQKVNVDLPDASGRTLLQRDFVPQTHQHREEFDLSQLTRGMYFLRVNTDQNRTTLKVVKIQ